MKWIAHLITMIGMFAELFVFIWRSL